MPHKDPEKAKACKRSYWLEHKEQSTRSMRKYRLKLKTAALEAYGGCRCACCGEEELKFLTLDHMNGDGKAHRAEMKDKHHLSGTWFYLALKKENYPKDIGLQVLCFNCNMGRETNGGICPHVAER